MYLLILEDGEIFKTDTLADEDKNAADEGNLEVIHISGDHPRHYFNDEFHEIRDISEITNDEG